MIEKTENTKPILLFDGVCNLCNNSVQQIIKLDPEGKIRFTSLQSEIGQSLLKKFDLPQSNFKTLVLVDGEKCFTQSDVVFEIIKKIGGIWLIFYVFKLIPRPIRNFFYDQISKNRYKLWGKQNHCMLPTPELKERFL